MGVLPLRQGEKETINLLYGLGDIQQRSGSTSTQAV